MDFNTQISKENVLEARVFFRKLVAGYSTYKLFKEKQYLYSAPLGFTPWKDILRYLMYYDNVLPQTLNHKWSDHLKADSEAGFAASYALYHDSPVRNISENIGKAFLKTSTKGVSKPPMALEHFIINLPNGLLLDEWDYPISSLLVMTFTCMKKACAKHGFNLGMDGLDGLYTFGFSDYGTVLVDTTRWDDMSHAEPDLNPYCVEGYKTETHNACLKMQQIAVNSLLTMAYRPELLSESEPISSGYSFRGFTKHKQARNNVWIGEGFIKKSRKRLQSDDREGSPVAPHWRRGHWHTYLTGQKRKKKSLKWIEPIYVNAAS